MFSKTPKAGTAIGFTSPHKYIQGPGTIKSLFEYAKGFGSKAFIVIDKFVVDQVRKELDSIEQTEVSYQIEPFFGYSCRENVLMLAEKLHAFGADVVVGIGGGSCLDTTKLLSDEVDLPRIIMPTAASNDGPVADWAGLYTAEGVHISGGPTRRSTELIIADTNIICNAPARLFAAGIGDALSTFFEARAVNRASSECCVGMGIRQSILGYAIAESCYKTLIECGEDALKDASAHVASENFERVVEAIILQSGLGFINGGLAAAHAFHAGISQLRCCDKFLHGEKVAFCTLCELELEGDEEGFRTVMEFLHRINLPICLSQFGATCDDATIEKITDHVLNRNILIYTEPVEINADTIKKAIISANAKGEEYLRSLNG